VSSSTIRATEWASQPEHVIVVLPFDSPVIDSNGFWCLAQAIPTKVEKTKQIQNTEAIGRMLAS
jgi:hypothetical protein